MTLITHAKNTPNCFQTLPKGELLKLRTKDLYDLKDVEDPFVWGTMQFCSSVASRLGLHLMSPPDDFLPSLSEEYLLRRVELTTVKEYRARPCTRTPKFVKPADWKTFVADIYASPSDVPWKGIDPKCPILVSDVVDFEYEYRCYCLDWKVEAASVYLWPNALFEPNESYLREATGFCSKVLSVAKDLPSALVIDVGRLSDGRWAVVEANQAYASGVYHEADPKAVLRVVQRSSSRAL